MPTKYENNLKKFVLDISYRRCDKAKGHSSLPIMFSID